MSSSPSFFYRGPSAPAHISAVERTSVYVYKDDEAPPYEHLDAIGAGGGGSVDAVRHTETGSVYARKTIFSQGVPEEKEYRTEMFNNEMKIIRGLGTHHHIVQVVDTYCHKKKLCLILDPLADKGDLNAFVRDFRDKSQTYDAHEYDTRVAVLNRAFGCLANGLAFMHRMGIRHKDVNPRNILVHQGGVIYTDFGLSRDFRESGRSTTAGPVPAMTIRYSAPEILGHEPRNTKSDVFSLACVFHELLATLTQVPVFPRDNMNTPFAYALNSIREQVQQSELSGSYAVIAEQMLSMLSGRQDNRPDSSEVDKELRKYAEHICNDCLNYVPESQETTVPASLGSFSRRTTFNVGADDPNDSSRTATPHTGGQPLEVISKSFDGQQSAPQELQNSNASGLGPEHQGATEDPNDLLRSAPSLSESHMHETSGPAGSADPVPWTWSDAYKDWYILVENKETKEQSYVWGKNMQ